MNTKKIISIALATSLVITNAFAGDKIKEVLAKDKMSAQDYRGALKMYYDMLAKEPNNAAYNYNAGQCLLELKKYEDAVTYFETTLKQKPQYNEIIHLSLAKCYHSLGKLDESLAEVNDYLASSKKGKPKMYDEAVEVKNAATKAKELIQKPLNVTITNMGDVINSKYDDYAPSITADGKTMVFTSRREDTRGGGVELDGKYFEDIYMTNFDEKTGKWTTAEAIKGSLNSEAHDASLSISPDGNQIFVYKNIPDETRSGDIYASNLSKTGKWSTPRSISEKINSSFFESSASLSSDGQVLYFVSERHGKNTIGNGDIYRVKKISKSDWGEPENLGGIVNTIEDEISVYIHPDGKTLFFSSKGHDGMGGYDIFKTTLGNDCLWSKPENLGYPINTTNDDLHFVLTADNTTAYYSRTSGPSALGERDIYKIDMTKSGVMPVNMEDVEKTKGLIIFKGDVIDNAVSQGIEADIVITDAATNEQVHKINSTTEGSYFCMLKGNKKYNVTITKDGFNTLTELIDLTINTNPSITKPLMLTRKQ
jgi:tetratricopeptide (TPR) repeat protein